MPVHTDEAVNASILGEMLEGRPYRYDPVDRHGPSLYYATYPVVRAFGAHSLGDLEAWELRLVPAVLGAGLLGALLLFLPAFPPPTLLASALWLGVGAPFVYYGRYWIHETLLVLLTFLLLGFSWRFSRTTRTGWAIAAGLAAGALLATKETSVLTLSCALGALVLTRLLCRRDARPPGTSIVPGVALGIAAAVLASALLFSSFGQNPGGIGDALAALAYATERAGGQGHEKPPLTYLGWLLAPNLRSRPFCGWTLAAFGLVGAWCAWQRRRDEPLPMFMALFAFITLAAYSAIPYKTPWLLLNALAPWALIAGTGLNRVGAVFAGRSRVVLTLALAAGVAGLLASETWRLCLVFPADPGNPLAYSPTSPDIRRLEARAESLVSERGALAPIVAVVGADIWPLPWYLRHCPNVGYWPELPRSPEATVVISDASQSERVSRALGPGWTSEIFGLRPEVLAVLFHRAPAESGIERKRP
jgi:uncharacterized protein (TIGR03663 family)